jgi:predicted RNA-binding Zn-ribbon protein involved in translation (DUF1610 family)
MGDTGTGKSLLLATFFLWVWENYGKRSRYVAVDPGGFPDLMMGLINSGIVTVWRPISRDPKSDLGLVLGTADRATQGYWPADVDPRTGNAAVACDLIPPQTDAYTLICPKGHDVTSAQSALMLESTYPCPSCGFPTSLQTCLRVRKDTKITPGFEDFGGWGCDGLSSLSSWVMTEMNRRAGMNMLGGIKGATQTQYSDDIIYGSAGQSGVGFAQDRVWEWIRNAGNIHGLVRPPVFTAIKKRAKDKEEGADVWGPEVAGNAKTSVIPQWFGHTLGTDQIDGQYRLYLKPYLQNNARHLIKTRIAGIPIPDFLADPPGATYENGGLLSKFNLGYFYEMFDQAVAKVLEIMKQRTKRPPPGIGDGKASEEARKLAVKAKTFNASADGAPTPPAGANPMVLGGAMSTGLKSMPAMPSAESALAEAARFLVPVPAARPLAAPAGAAPPAPPAAPVLSVSPPAPLAPLAPLPGAPFPPPGRPPSDLPSFDPGPKLPPP